MTGWIEWSLHMIFLRLYFFFFFFKMLSPHSAQKSEELFLSTEVIFEGK